MKQQVIYKPERSISNAGDWARGREAWTSVWSTMVTGCLAVKRA